MKKIIVLLGAVNLAVLTVRAILSYFLVTVTPFGIPQENEQLFFNQLAEKLAFFGPGFQALISGNSIFRDPTYFTFAATTPLFISSVIFAALLIILVRNRKGLTDDSLRSLYRWSIVFICVSALSFPVFAQDFWLSIGWGRMTAAGVNPYYFDLSQEYTSGLPLDYTLGRMTYGPLWALISGIVAWISGSNVLAAAVLFKLLLAGALVGSLILIWELLDDYAVYYRCLGVALFGWLPLTLTEFAADGHNDIVMVFFLLLWLYLLRKGRMTAASVALAASVLIKYVTAPLFLLEILYFYYSLRRPLRTIVLPLAASGALMVAVTGLFFRSTEFFEAASTMRSWHFFTPQEAIALVCRWIGLSGRLKYLPMLVFPLTSVYEGVRYFKLRTDDSFRLLVLAVMATILFTAPGHIFPWYLLWVTPLCALLPSQPLSRWVIGAALAFPFALLPLQFSSLSGLMRWELPGLLIFVFAFVWQFASAFWPFATAKVAESDLFAIPSS